jgi:hypothetical protein
MWVCPIWRSTSRTSSFPTQLIEDCHTLMDGFTVRNLFSCVLPHFSYQKRENSISKIGMNITDVMTSLHAFLCSCVGGFIARQDCTAYSAIHRLIGSLRSLYQPLSCHKTENVLCVPNHKYNRAPCSIYIFGNERHTNNIRPNIRVE